jgi:hypothetical protein
MGMSSTQPTNTSLPRDMKDSTSVYDKSLIKSPPNDSSNDYSLSKNNPAGMDEIDQLFSSKKEKMKKRRLDQQQEELDKYNSRKMMNKEERKTTQKQVKKINLQYDREDLSKIKTGEWASDGLGGVFDADGWTGRTESGMKIYKHHLFNKKNAGRTKDCPFDCDCCYI